MELTYLELLHTLSNREASWKERLSASDRLWRAVLSKRIQGTEVTQAYKIMVQCWKHFGDVEKDRQDKYLFALRKHLALNCELVSRRLSEGQRFFCYFPKIELAEGPRDTGKDGLVRGAIRPCSGFKSIYEFHCEYPIEGYGVRKDRISVITRSGEPVPLFDWCEMQDIIVYCNRCGLEITYEVSKNCPWRKRRYESH